MSSSESYRVSSVTVATRPPSSNQVILSLKFPSHLLIMEELGGNQRWFDRFLAQHMALGYFFLALSFYIFNPTFAYNFNQAVEEEAFETYNRFLTAHEEFLKSQPAPVAAKEYYLGDDLYMFDCISKDIVSSRVHPTKMETLYDCFSAIRDDEGEHVKTMISMQAEGL
jgi:ubiquinol oxidase